MEKIEQLPFILDKITPKTLVIFDVDEVLLYPTNVVQLQIASPFWEATMADIEQRLGKPIRDLLHSIMLLQSRWKLTDTDLPKMIKALQQKNIQVLALTSFRRGALGKMPSVESWRQAELKKYNVDFTLSINLPNHPIEIINLKKVNDHKKPLYKNGIIYTDLHSKSDVLDSFLDQTNLKPEKIIFVDDRIPNIEDVETLCKTRGIPFIGVYDNRIVIKHPSFDINLGKYQFHYLEHHHVWLSDQEAKQRLSTEENGKVATWP